MSRLAVTDAATSRVQRRGARHERGERLGYRPALDGMRAVAVIAVMLYHGGVSWLGGGFLGVDVFFVLSGFLITSLLAQEWRRNGRIDLRAFWMRRARRLLPATFLVLIVVAAYFGLVSVGPQPLLRGDALATFGYVSNWWFIITGESYFEQFLQPSPLRHTWSLAIEEQFYLAFPIFLIFLLGRAGRSFRGARNLVLAGALGSAVLMAWLYEPLTDPSRLYYGTDTRAQALLLGASLALAPVLARPVATLYTRVGGRIIPLPGWGTLGWLALAGLLSMFVAARELAPWMYQGGFLLAAVLSAILIASACLAPGSTLGRFLAARLMVSIGVISYGLYLWHWPVYVALTHEVTGLDGVTLLLLRVGVTAALAWTSYRFVEEPIRTQRWRRRFTVTQWSRVIAGSVLVTGALVLGMTAGAASSRIAGSQVPQEANVSPVADAKGRIVKAFLIGDSQSFHLRMNYANDIPGLAVSGSTQLGCGTLLPERHVDGQTIPNLPACSEWEPRMITELAHEDPDIAVLMLGMGDLFDRRVNGVVVPFGTDRYREWLFSEIDHRADIVKAQGATFAVATVLCMNISADASDRHAQLANDPSRLAWLNDTIRAYGAAHQDVPVIDLHGTICGGGYTNDIGGVTLRDDGLHLNEAGSRLVWDRIGPTLVTVVSN